MEIDIEVDFIHSDYESHWMSESQVMAFLLQRRKAEMGVSDVTAGCISDVTSRCVSSEISILTLRHCSKNAITCDSDIQLGSFF